MFTSAFLRMNIASRISWTHLIQFSLVVQSCLTFCDPMDCSTPGLPVHHQLLEFTQTHVHWVGDSINHLILCCPILFPPSIFPSIRVYSNESVFHIRWPKYWSFSINISPSNEHPGLPKPISKQNPSQIAGLFSFLNNFLNFQKSVNTHYLFPTLHSKYPWHQR